MVRIFLLAGALITAFTVSAQKKLSTEEYINLYSNIAVGEMYRTGIPASIKIAQGILESGSGNSRLATEGNNHFGIKCHKEWNGPAIYADDDAKNECFRKYKFAEESYLDHSDFLTTRSRYSDLFKYDKTDYKNWAHGLKKAGYATNPEYANLLIGLIERYNLSQLDHASPGKIVKIDREDQQKGDEKLSGEKAIAKNIFTTNRIKTVFLQPGQTLDDIAKAHDIRGNRLQKYNEVDDEHQLQAGMKVFLQPKRNKGAIKYHKVQKGETMYSISQNYGVKLSSLYKKNNLEEGEEPAVGERINLRKNKKSATKTRDINKEQQEKKIVEKTKSAPEKPKSAEKPPAEEKAPVAEVKAEVKKEQPYQKRSDAKEVEDGDLVFIDSEDHQVTLNIKKGKEDEEKPVKAEEKKSVPAAQQYHTVKEGDTLYNLSRKYNITVAQIREWNALEADVIKIGQTIIVGVSK